MNCYERYLSDFKDYVDRNKCTKKKIRTSANSNAVYLIIVRRDLHFSPITIKMLNESISQEKKSTLNKIMTNDCVLNDSVICVFPWHCL